MNTYFKMFILATVSLTLLIASSESAPPANVDSASVKKDIDDLKAALIEEKARRMALETNFTNLQSILYTIQEDMMKQFQIINGQIDKLVNGQNVAFNARLSKSIENIQPWATIVFTDVETNIGEGYNNVTGEFTAPISGRYVFFSNILSAQDKNIETSLRINGHDKMYVYSAGKYHGSGSNMAVVHLNAGDVVKMVKHGSWGTQPFYIHQSWSSFSGFLLQADSAALVPTPNALV